MYHFHNKKGLHNVCNLPEALIGVLVHSPKSYRMYLIYQKQLFHTVLSIQIDILLARRENKMEGDYCLEGENPSITKSGIWLSVSCFSLGESVTHKDLLLAH